MSITDDKVTALPTLLERLGRRIDQAWQRIRQGEHQWIEGSLELAKALAEGREQFSANQAFGTWLKENGHDHVNDHDRAALINLASDLVVARDVLTKTTRRSYQYIWNEDQSRFAHVSKTAKPKRGRRKGESNSEHGAKERVSRRGQSMPQLERAREIVRPLMDAGKPFQCHDLEREHGISHYTFDSAICAEKARLETLTEIGAIADLSKMTAKEKLDAAVRAHKKLLDREYDQRRIKEIGDHIKRIMPTLQQEKNEAFQREQTYREFLQKQKKIMTVADYTLVCSLLHPDSRISASDERLRRAFQMFQPKKFALTGEK